MRKVLIVIGLQMLVLMLAQCGKDNWACLPGEKAACECAGGAGSGVWECSASGHWGRCQECASCTPGRQVECACEGGEVGYQICAETGDSWGECEGCEPVSGGTDPSDLDDCEYNACVGDICEEPEDCCEASACGSWYYGSEYGFSENYCFPMCDESSDELCKCGDVCVDFGGGFTVCLPEGSFELNNQKLPVGEDFESAYLVDATESDLKASIGSDDIPISTLYAYWWEGDDPEDRWMVIRTEGMSLSNDFWSVNIYIPEPIIESGVGTYPLYNEEDYNFLVEVHSGNMNSDGEITDLWLETLVDDAELNIAATCEPCPADEVECEECEFSVSAYFFGMRSKYE